MKITLPTTPGWSQLAHHISASDRDTRYSLAKVRSLQSITTDARVHESPGERGGGSRGRVERLLLLLLLINVLPKNIVLLLMQLLVT